MKPIFTLLLSLLSLQSIGQIRLVEEEIVEGISMLVPIELSRTPQSNQRATSLSLAVFNSQDGRTDLGINKAQLKWSNTDIELLSRFYKANILNLYDHVTMHDEGIKEINGNKFIIFELSGTFVDEGNAFSGSKQNSDYTYLMYSVRKDGILIFRLTCPLNRRRYWQKTTREIMNSVTITEGKKKR